MLDPTRFTKSIYIDREWHASSSGAEFTVTNPATAASIGSVADGGQADAQVAIAASSAALSAWSARTPYERSELLYRAHGLMLERAEELASLMTLEQGKPLRAARIEVKYASDFLIWFAEEAKRIYGRTIPSARSDQRFVVQHRPVGVVAAITPWNYPISMITRKLGPALAAGCTVVLKPAEQTPLCAAAVIEIFHDAGFPAGVVGMVTCQHPAPVGDEFLSNRDVRKITFTGSTEVGKSLIRGSADQLKRLSLELGGHAPFIVFSDADPAHAAKGAAMLKMLNTGQACISPNRIYVHRSLHDRFVDVLSQRVGSMQIGSGFDEKVSIGPLIDETALRRMELQVEDAAARGAEVVLGGSRATGPGLDEGYFFSPTVLTGVSNNMTIHTEETFGPIAPVIAFDDEDEVIAAANDTCFGLASYIYTNDLSRAYRFSEALQFGMVGINDINPTSAAAPFGGVKESGVGREGAAEGIHEYLDMKVVGISI